MVRQFDDISRTIGNIEGKLTSLATQTATDMAAIRHQISLVVSSLDRLPPSPVCIKKHEELDEKISEIKTSSARHTGFVGGAAAVGTLALQWVLSHLGVSFGGK